MRSALFLLIIGGLVVLGVLVGGQLFDGSLNRSGNTDVESPTNAVNAKTVVNQTRSADGIDVTIDNVRRTDTQTIVVLLLNNHQIDLSAFDLSIGSKLGDAPAVRYAILSNGGSGHHVSAELAFPPDATGMLTVALDDQRVFTFDEPL